MKQLSVVLADDDHLVLRDLQHMVDWAALGFSICATASSGEEVLELLERYHPFLLITDIRMMGMNGLDAIEIAHEKYPHMKFLVISSYDDFHYVKRALSSGVMDYLLKTEITPGTLTEKLLEAKSAYSREHLDLTSRISRQLEQSFASDTPEDLSASPLLADYADRSYYFHCISIARLFSRNPSEAQDRYQQQLAAASSWIYQEALENCSFPVIFFYRTYILVGLSSDLSGRSEADTRRILRQFHYRLAKLTNNTFLPSVIYYSMKAQTLSAFHRVLRLLTPRLQYHLYFYPENAVDLAALEKEPYIPVGRSFPFHSLVMDKEHVEQDVLTLKAYLETCFEGRDLAALEQFYLAFCTHLEIISHNRIDLPGTLHAPTGAFFQKWVYNSLNDCILLLEQGDAAGYSPVVEKAIEFMKEQYANPDLSGMDIAESVGLSANRLGVVLKQETGRTINEYLSMVRVEQAIHLLKKTNLKIYEIAERCGYKSSQYFSQIMVQKTGHKPIEYRRSR